MRKLYFLLPGLGGRFACGGLWAELKTLRLVQDFCEAAIVTYQQREADTLFLPDLLKNPPESDRSFQDSIFVVSWGFDVPRLIQKLKPYNLVYHAHSAEYGFRLPAEIPILTVSRNTLGYWGQRAPAALLYYLPNEISPDFENSNVDHPERRDIDVLVQERKSSRYLLRSLVPALQPHCRVEVVRGFVDDLPALFNRTRVYLYDSAEYWAVQGVTEGFGLQPLEAIACGCQVFSSLNHGLSDYLDPGFNCQKISGYSLDYDVHRILKVVQNYSPPGLSPETLAHYRKANIQRRLQQILLEINAFFDFRDQHPPHPGKSLRSPLTDLSPWRLLQLRWQQKWQKIQRKLSGKKL